MALDMAGPVAGLPLPTGARLDVSAAPGGWRLDLRPDGDPAPDASRWLVEQLAAPSDVALPDGDFRVRRFTGPDVLPVRPPAGERAVAAERAHRSVVVGERLVVTWLHQVADVEHPALRVLRHLTEVGFDGVPATLGALTWLSPSGRDLPCAVVTGFLTGATDGWQWCVQAVDARQQAGIPAELGRLAARLHAALGSPSSLLPLPVGAAGVGQVRRWHADARRLLAQVQDRDLPHRRRIESVIDGLLDVQGRTPVQQIHGDLQVGRVVRRPGGPAVIDVDGLLDVPGAHSPAPAGHRPESDSVPPAAGGVPPEGSTGPPEPGRLPAGPVRPVTPAGPVRPVTPAGPDRPVTPAGRLAGAASMQPAARDVARLMLSLDQVGRLVDRRSGHTRTAEIDAWSVTARAELLAAYQGELAELERPDVLDARLLPSFLVEQACRDLLLAGRSPGRDPDRAGLTAEGLATLLESLPAAAA